MVENDTYRKTLKKTRVIAFVVLVIIICGLSRPSFTTSASEEDRSLETIIKETIDSDAKTLKLGPILQKAYDKLVSAFKKAGTLAKDVSKVIKLYNALDEDAEDYTERLKEFFDEYSKLSTIKRKLVDFCTNLLDTKDKLLESVRHHVLIDLYSEKQLDTALEGKIHYTSLDDTVATVDANGRVSGVGVGMAKIVCSNDTDEEVFRVFVTKPLLNTAKITVKKNGKAQTISVPSSEIVSVTTGNKKISAERNGSNISVKGLKKGKSNVYVGLANGQTFKYKILIE